MVERKDARHAARRADSVVENARYALCGYARFAVHLQERGQDLDFRSSAREWKSVIRASRDSVGLRSRAGGRRLQRVRQPRLSNDMVGAAIPQPDPIARGA